MLKKVVYGILIAVVAIGSTLFLVDSGLTDKMIAMPVSKIMGVGAAVAVSIAIERSFNKKFEATKSEPHPKEQPPHDLELMKPIRQMVLTTPPAVLGLEPTEVFPKVYGVVFEWPIGNSATTTVVALCDGNASVYTTGTFGVTGGYAHETIRTAAKAFVREAQDFCDEAKANNDFPYPRPGRTRFYILTYTGVRFIDTDEKCLESGNKKYSELNLMGHILLAEIRCKVQAQGTVTTNNRDQGV